MEIKFGDKSVALNTQMDAMEAVKLSMLETVNDMSEVNLDRRSPAFCAFVKKPAVADRIKACFEKESVKAVFVASDRDLRVCGMTQTDANRAAAALSAEILEKRIPLDKEKADCTNSREWQKLMNDFRAEFELFEVSDEREDEVVVVAFQGEFERIVKKVRMHAI